MKSLKATMAVIAAVLLVPIGSAAAADYEQVVCFDPASGAGVGAPPELARSGGAPFNELWIDCGGNVASNKGLLFQGGLPSHTSNGDRGELAYTAPDGVTLLGGTIYRAFRAANGNGHKMVLTQHGGSALDTWSLPRGEEFYWYYTAQTFTNRGSTVDFFGAANRVDLVVGGGKVWRYTGMCDSADADGCWAQPGETALRIFGGRLRLRDSSNPVVVSSASGTLITDATLTGSEDVTFNATDVGSGVYRVRVVAGATTLAQLVDDNSGDCQDVAPGSGTAYEFRRAAPCKPSAGGTFSFDTTLLPEGAQTVKVQVEDAAGNVTTLASRSVKVDNVPPPANTQAPSIAGLPKVGNGLSGDEGSWSGADVSFAFQWQRCEADGATCSAVAGATSRTYTLGETDAGRRMRLKVVASNGEGATEAFSVPTAAVSASSTSGATPSSADPAGPVAPGGSTPGGGDSGSGSGGTVLPVGTPNGTNATVLAVLTAHESITERRTIRTRYGRPVVLTGRLLTPAGAPISGAELEVVSQDRYIGSPLIAHRAAVTDSNGAYRIVMPNGPSRTIRVGYRARIGDLSYARTSDVEVRVIATMAFRLSKRKLRNRQTLRYLGKIRGPRTGHRFVEVQVRNGRRWQIVCSVRTDARGSFGCAHRFRRTYRRTTYVFRARVRRQAGFPYEPGTSVSRRATVRP